MTSSRLFLCAVLATVAPSYAGDGKFEASTSAAVTIVISNADFSLGATPSTATVTAGGSTQFMVSEAPSGGFAAPDNANGLPVDRQEANTTRLRRRRARESCRVIGLSNRSGAFRSA